MNKYFHLLCFFVVIALITDNKVFSQVANKVGSKNCATATQLCNNDVIEDQLLATGIGINDIPVNFSSCFAPKTERNPFWYQFTPENNGSFEMYLNASEGKDFDFIIFDITNGCASKSVLQCNSSQLDLDSNFIGTGVSTDSLLKYEVDFPGIQNSWTPTLNVTTGKRYAIYIENRQLVLRDTFQVTFGGSARFRNIDAKFTANEPFCFGKPVVFTNQTVGTGTITYLWNFGDGNTSTQVNPVHNYTIPGSYWVKLIAGNGRCSYEDSLLIDIPITIAANAGSDVQICNTKSVTLNATGGINYSWTPSTGLSNAGIFNPIASPTSTTTYTVTVTDAQGCRGTDQVTVTVNANPIVDAGTDAQICIGDSIQLNASGAIDYLWTADPSLSNINISNPFAKPSTNKTYIVTGTDALGCSSQDIVTITLKTLPNANAGNDATICLGKTTTLAATGGVSYSWSPSNGLTDPNIANPDASPLNTTNYIVTVTGLNGCKNTDNVLVTVNPLPNANAGNDVTICEGDQTQLNATGGVTYSWSPSLGLSNVAIPNPVANPVVNTTYTVTVTDALGCVNSDDLELTVNAAPIVNAGTDLTICNGDSIQLNASGVTNYVWTPTFGLSNPNIPNPFAKPNISTTYILTGDNGGCVDRDTIVITVNSKPVANAGPDVFVCNGKPAQLNATGGVSYTWTPSLGLFNPNIANPIATPIVNTNYKVTVTGGNGCTSFDEVLVSVAPNPIVNAGSDLSICQGSGTSLNASGGVSYVWSPSTGLSNPAIGNPFANPTATTTYTVVATDALGCQGSDNILITVEDLPVIDAGSNKIICNKDTIQLQASGGISYTWLPVASLNSPSISNPKAFPSVTTTYIVSGSNGTCSNIDSVRVTVNQLPNANAGNDVSVCNGKPAQLSASGGLIYSWSPFIGLSNPNIFNPIASPTVTTNYTLTVTDANNCKSTDELLISVAPNPTANAGGDKIICRGTGIQLNSSGGVVYSWSPSTGLSNFNSNNPFANPITNTTYTLTVTDASGCQDSDVITITVNDLPIIDAGGNKTICAKDSVQLEATGAITYSWSSSSSLTNANISNPKAFPLTTTTFVVTGSNGNCSNTDSVRVFVNALPNANAGNDVSVCNGKPAQLSATGGVSYSWFPAVGLSNASISNPIASPIVNTKYFVTVTGINGCKTIDSISVSLTSNPNVSVSATDSKICLGTPTNISATGGVNYLWTPSTGLSNPSIASPVATPLTATRYKVLVTDASGCQATDSILIEVDALPNVVASDDDSTCIGISVQLNASGAINYEWSPSVGLTSATISNPIALPLASTLYTVKGTDANGCSNTDQVSIKITNGTPVNAGQDVSFCFGKNTTLNATGNGNNFTWTPSIGLSNSNIANPIASPERTTTYTVAMTDNKGCTNIDSLVVNVDYININVTKDTVLCSSNILQLNASGGVTYLWTPSIGLNNSSIANPIATLTSNIKYRVDITDNNGCKNFDSVDVVVSSIPSVNTSKDTTICNGKTVPLFATGGVNYTWAPSEGLNNSSIANPIASPTKNMQYIVTVSGANGCSQRDTVNIGVTFINVATSNDTSVCFGKPALLSATGGVAYEWLPNQDLSSPNNASTSASPTFTTNYKVTVTDADGCKNTDSVKVEVTYITTNLSNDTLVCKGTTVNLLASGGVSYSWSPAIGLSATNIPNPEANPLLTTKYYVVIADNSGCQNIDSLEVGIKELPSTNAGKDTSVCNGNSANLFASGGASYQWSPTTGLSDPSIPNPIAKPNARTEYIVKATDIQGCSQEDTVVVDVTFINILKSADTTVCFGSSANIRAFGGTTFQWSPSIGLSDPNAQNPIATPTVTQKYKVLVTDAQGCQNEDSLVVNVNQLPVLDAGNDLSICLGKSVLLNATLGYSYTWTPVSSLSNPNISSPEATPTATTKYFVTAIDNLGCTNIDSVTVNVTTTLSATATALPDTFCSSSPVTLSAVVGAGVTLATSPYSFDGGKTFQTANIFNLLSVTEDSVALVMVKDITGCLSDTINVNLVRKKFIADVVQVSPVTCGGLNNGVAQIINIKGGQAPYLYYLLNQPPSADSVFRNLAVGTQTLFVKDQTSCESKYSIDITSNPSITKQISIIDAKCFGGNDGSITINASGGSGLGFTYSMDNNSYVNNNEFLGISTGFHMVYIKDSFDCLDSAQVEIKSPTALSIQVPNAPENVTCFGRSDGSIEFSAQGGISSYLYSLNNINYLSDSNFSNLSNGNYKGYVKDANGCIDSINFVIKMPDSIIAYLSKIQMPKCGGVNGIILIDSIKGGTPNYRKIINGGAPVLSDTLRDFLPGAHVITISDRNGCENNFSITFDADSNAIKGLVSSDSATCFNSRDGKILLSNLIGGNKPYLFSLQDTLSYQPDSIFTNLPKGITKIFAKNANGCISQFTTSIGEPDSIQAKIISQENLTCFGANNGKVSIEGIGGRGGYTYSLDNIIFTNNNLFENLSKGIDTLYIADKNLCKGSVIVNINSPDSISVNIAQSKPSSCIGGDGEATISLASGGTGVLSYSINNGIDFQNNNLFTGLSTGTYSLLVKDINLCSKNYNFEITSLTAGLDLAAINKAITDIACKSNEKGKVVLSNFVGAPSPYLFALAESVDYTNDSIFTNLPQGQNIIKIKDGNQCNYQLIIDINKPDTISFEIDLISLETCINADGVIEIKNVNGAAGNYKYQIDNNPFQNSTRFNGLKQGMKSVTVTDTILPTCASTIDYFLAQKPGPIAQTSKFNPLCFGQENGRLVIDTVIGGLAPYLFSLDSLDGFAPELTFEGLKADTFTLYIKDSECSVPYKNIETVITINPNNEKDTTYVPYFVLKQPDSLSAETFYFEGFGKELEATSGVHNIIGGTKPYYYSLSKDTLFQKVVSDTVLISGLREGNYTIYLKDTNGCKQQVNINIGQSFKIPNLFSPNGDKKNDYFEITGLRDKSKLSVVNRWGVVVYQNDDYDNSWDGEDCSDGVYYYTLEIPGLDTYKGWIQISRGQ